MNIVEKINVWMRPKVNLEAEVTNAEKALAQNRMKDAFRLSGRALRINPDCISAIRVYVKAGVSLRKYKGLDECCDKLIKEDSSNPEHWYFKGYVLAKRREPHLPVPEGGFTQADVKAHPLHFTDEYKNDLRKAKECLYKAENLEDECHHLPENQKQSRFFFKLTREQFNQCIELSSQAWNILYDERAAADDQRKLKELAKQQDRLHTAQFKDPDTR